MTPPPLRFLPAILLFVLCMVPGALSAQGVRYDATIAAVEDGDLTAALEASSNLVALEDEPVSGIAGLIRRARADSDRLTQALRAFGYYNGDVTVRIATFDLNDPALAASMGDAAPDAPVEVLLIVRPGPVYRVAEIDLKGADGGDPAVPIDRAALPLAVGDPARSALILEAEEQLVAQMRAEGHPFAAVPGREAVVDHATREMFLTWTLDAGPAATLGSVAVEGLERVDESFVRQQVPYRIGEPYDPEQIETLRDNLTEAGVFSSVRIEPADALDGEGRLPVTVTVLERDRRFVGFGADYSTTEGFGANAYWGHRNLFGGAESLRLEGEVSRIGQSSDVGGMDYRLNLDFRKPDLFLRGQDLVSSLTALSENPDAYERQAVLGAIGLEREISDTITAGAGLSFEYAEITEDGVTDQFFLVGVPLSVAFDTRDDLLDPAEGTRIDLSLTPYPTLLGSSRNLVIARTTATAYEDFGTDGKAILAGRISLGSLFGESLENVPADKRFYAGGGGSVRGYEYQGVGPREPDGDPLGGRSLFEASLELRYKVTESIGIVPFVDAGGVFESSIPDFSEEVRFAAGIGGRYYTGFGPIRLDLAFPLNPEEDDDAFAFYVSLGQAF